MKRVLVTGATGFLGRHVVDVLTARGFDVVSLVRTPPPVPRPRAGAEVALGKEETRIGDVRDRDAVSEAARGCDVAFHCAGRVSRDAKHAGEMRELHVVGTRAVLDACEAEGVGRVVIASTSGVVAVSEDGDRVSTEDDETPYALVNQWPYYRSKLWAEREALARSRAGFEVVSVNPSLLLGPGDVRGSSTEDVRLFLEGRVLAVPAGGISFVDARDAADAMVRAAERGVAGTRYLLGACNLTLRELFARLERVSGVRAPWAPLPREATRAAGALLERFAAALGREPLVDAASLDLSQYYWYVDASRAERDLAWTPRDPTATLADTVADLRARGVVWPRAGGGERETHEPSAPGPA